MSQLENATLQFLKQGKNLLAVDVRMNPDEQEAIKKLMSDKEEQVGYYVK